MSGKAYAVWGILAALRLSAASCSVSPDGPDFGAYDPFDGGSVTTTGTITLRCTTARPAQEQIRPVIRLSTGSSNDYARRTLRNRSVPGSVLYYNLYTGSDYAQVWGDGSGGSSIVSDRFFTQALSPVTRTYTLYGRIPAAQDPDVGYYTDTVIVTVEY
jgi:spore coat protein U-like protein